MKWTIYFQYITKNNLLFYKFIYTVQSQLYVSVLSICQKRKTKEMS